MSFIKRVLQLFNQSKSEKVMEQPEVKPSIIKKVRVKKENTKFSQVRNHLIEKGSIDSWTAINLYGATRLSAIIFILRNTGYNIISVPNCSYDRNNNICNFVTYKYIKE